MPSTCRDDSPLSWTTACPGMSRILRRRSPWLRRWPVTLSREDILYASFPAGRSYRSAAEKGISTVSSISWRFSAKRNSAMILRPLLLRGLPLRCSSPRVRDLRTGRMLQGWSCMPIRYKGITAILALTGCLSLLITGEVNLLMCLGGLTLFPGYYRFFKGYPQASKRAGAILAQAALLVFLADASIISGDVFLAVAHMTITFQGIKSFDLKEPWDHLQVYFMSLLQLIIASELTRALAFGVIFIVFMILLVTAMVFSHFLKEGALG